MLGYELHHWATGITIQASFPLSPTPCPSSCQATCKDPTPPRHIKNVPNLKDWFHFHIDPTSIQHWSHIHLTSILHWSHIIKGYGVPNMLYGIGIPHWSHNNLTSFGIWGKGYGLWDGFHIHPILITYYALCILHIMHYAHYASVSYTHLTLPTILLV